MELVYNDCMNLICCDCVNIFCVCVNFHTLMCYSLCLLNTLLCTKFYYAGLEQTLNLQA